MIMERRLSRSGTLLWNENDKRETTFTTRKGPSKAARTFKNDRSRISDSLTDLLSHPSQSSSKPFGCPNLDCSRSFITIAGLLYHTSQGYCISPADQIYPLQVVASSSDTSKTKLGIPSDSIRKATSKHGGVFRRTFSKLLGKTKPLNRGHPGRLAPTQIDDEVNIRRGRPRYRTSRATSAPRIHKLNRSLPSQLTCFPPPQPRVSNDQQTKVQLQQGHDERQSESHLRLAVERRRRSVRKEVKVYVDSVNEEDRTENTAFNILRSRPLSSRRLSEQNPVLSRPYSQFSNPSRHSSGSRSSRSSSIQASSMGHISRLRLNGYSLSPPPGHSVFPEILAEPHVSLARLAKPLPLPPGSTHLGRATRDSEWENSSDSIRKYANRHIISTKFGRAVSPRNFSSRRSIPRFTHRSSRYPTTSYLSRSLGSFFSDLPSIIPSPPSSGSSLCSRTSSLSASADYAPGHGMITYTTLSTRPTCPISMVGNASNLHEPSSSTLTF